MSENTAPPAASTDPLKQHPQLALMDPSRTLISPPPEEELQRNIFGFPRTNNVAQVKRKRTGTATPSKATAEHIEVTPNPKPRKSHRRRQSQVQDADSPTRSAFPRVRNPNADWLPQSSSRRSLTPYEPPLDIFIPPREVVLQTPVQKPRAPPATKRTKQATPQLRARTATPLRVVVQSVKKELPPIDLTRPMTPPSPTDDPLLLVASSSPIKRNRPSVISKDDEHCNINPAGSSSDPAFVPFDWTVGINVDSQGAFCHKIYYSAAHVSCADYTTSDSMDLDPPESFDGPLPLQGNAPGWDSDDDDDIAADEGELPAASHLSTRIEPLQPTCLSLPSPAFFPSISPASIPLPTTPPRIRRTSSATGPYSTLLFPTKLDPPTPSTKARAEAWGVWGSPYPGRGIDGDGSFRMDGRRDKSALVHDIAPAREIGEGEEEAAMRQDEEDDEDMEDGVSFLHALREEDAMKARASEHYEDEEEEDRRTEERKEQKPEEEEEVRGKSLEIEAAPQPATTPVDTTLSRFVVRTPPRGTCGATAGHAQASALAKTYTQTPPIRCAPSVPARTERFTPLSARVQKMPQEQVNTYATMRDEEVHESSEVDTNADSEATNPGPSVFNARGTRPPSFVDASRELQEVLGASNSTGIADRESGDLDVDSNADGDDSSEETDSSLLGFVKISSIDPRAAARAAAILKQHDYDCFTRLQHKRRRHSYAGISKTPVSSPARASNSGKIQDISQLRARAAKEKKAPKERRASARVVGERVYFPGSPAPVTTAQLLAEAEREVVSLGISPRKETGVSDKHEIGSAGSISAFRVMSSSTSGLSHSRSVETPAPASRSGRRSSLARELPLPDSDDDSDEEMNTTAREWTKADWKALDACFTDERIAIASRLGMVPNLSPAPAPASVSASFTTPPRRGLGSTRDVVMMASADVVDLAAVVHRFERLMGGKHILREYGPSWEMESLTKRVQALQNKQRAGHVAPPTPRMGTDEDTFASRNRRPSMEVPDFTPLGKRAMPPRKPRLPPPVTGGTPFSDLPPTPEPVRRRRVPGSLLAPRYSHLLEEARAISVPQPKGTEADRRDSDVEDDQSLVDERDTSATHGQEASFATDQSSSAVNEDSSFASSSADSGDEEMAPATPLREREAFFKEPVITQPAPATIGKRVKGFLFSYLPTLTKTAPPAPARLGLPARQRLPLPPLELLEKPRGPITTPARPPLPKARAPKELVTLQPAPPLPKSLIPRRAPPRRLVELQHVSPPSEAPPAPRPRTSSGGSVKDLVKNFESLEQARSKAPEVKRVRSMGDFGSKTKADAVRPAWR
ncbi:hypothetical protein GGX14DRAFT_464486 [Mycena pura]|uniref:Uncharacterized protein n=1 Tax=Mycena pura TaxID=153505 RepID=A0AAD6V2Z1_9AGAR|nr:hypothetical protein GGX14DRAFT_464486 [Mycena pura]